MKKGCKLLIALIISTFFSGCGNDVDSSGGDNSGSFTSSIIENSDSKISKRPVWVLGHHCNSNYADSSGALRPQDERDVYKALASGCNGVEIDLAYRKSDNEIVLWHPGEVFTSAETLTQFLSLPEMNDSRMSMVIFDIKDYEYIEQVVDTTHEFYENNPVNQKINFVYSVSELQNLEVDGDPYYRFRKIAPLLWTNEALGIDYENDANEVQTMFNQVKFTRGVFGNGIFSGQARGNIENSCKDAVVLKNNFSNPYRIKAVESWTVNTFKTKNMIFYENVGLLERIEWGCDIVLADGFKELNESSYHTFYAYDLPIQNNTVRLAERTDYPFGER